MRKLNAHKGFSTVEIMIAMAIMIMAVSAVVMTSSGNQNFLVGAETNAEAVNIAQELLEKTQAAARKDFRTVNPTAPAMTPDGYYKTWIDVGPSSQSGDYFTKQVTSHVSWTDDSKIAREASLSTLVTNFGDSASGDTCNSFLMGDWTNPKTASVALADVIGDPSGSYPVAGLDVYEGKMYVAVNSAGLSSGPNNSLNGEDDSAAGSVAWNSAGSGRVSANLVAGDTTHYMRATNFGFAIPASATIVGIKVEIKRSVDGSLSGGVKDREVRIIKSDGNMGVMNKADTAVSWPMSASEDYDSSYTQDLWNEKWSPADINSPNFGVAISAEASANRIASLGAVRITVFYSKTFYVFDVSNPSLPLFVGSLGSDVINSGVNAITTDGRYVYLAMDSAGGQLQIVDTNTTPFELLSTLKIGGGGTSVGSSIFYRNGYVYLGLTNTAGGPAEFNIIDVRNHFFPQVVGSYSIGHDVNSVYVKNNYAYIAQTSGGSSHNEQLLALDISDPFNPRFSAGSFYYNGAPANGKSFYSVGDIAYLGATVSSEKEFYSLNLTDPKNIPATPLTQKEIGADINGLLVRDYLAFLLMPGQLQIINAKSTASVASVALPSGANGTALDCEGNNIYAGSVDSSNNGYITVINAQ